MGSITGLTKERMLAIEAESIVDGSIDSFGHLVLERHDGDTIDAGSVQGPQGIPGPPGPSSIVVCTSTTRPTGTDRFPGLGIYETDTQKVFVWNGAIWGIWGFDGKIVPVPSWHRVGQTGEPVFENGWGNYTLPGNWQYTRFFLSPDDFVSIEGILDGGSDADGTVLFTLPAGYRPTRTVTFVVPCSPSPPVNPGRIDIASDGTVAIRNTDVGTGFEFVSLSGIRFSTH
jgi:hypothetical protein